MGQVRSDWLRLSCWPSWLLDVVGLFNENLNELMRWKKYIKQMKGYYRECNDKGVVRKERG